MIKGKAEYEYVIIMDSFRLFFPEGNYDIDTLLEWYKIIPTEPKILAYYGDNSILLKRHFENFIEHNIVTKIGNDLHAEKFLDVHCMAIIDLQGKVVSFAAQEWINGFAAEKKISDIGSWW